MNEKLETGSVGKLQTSKRLILSLFLAGVVLGILIGLAYHDAPKNGFHFDDIHNIRDNAAVRMEALSFNNLKRAALDSPLKARPIPYISFAIDWWRGKGEASTFQMTNIIIHWANSLIVFSLILIVLRFKNDFLDGTSFAAALSGAALWAVHPIHVQAVTYIVQRMAQLAAFFTCLAITLYLCARISKRNGIKVLLFLFCALSVFAAVFSKENTYIIPFLFLLVELGVVRHNRQLLQNRFAKYGLILFLFLPAAAFFATLSGIGPLSEYLSRGFIHRNFTIIERVLTQPRVIIFHFSQIFWPLPSRFSLEHDFTVSRSLVNPPSTVFGITLALVLCTIGLWLLRKKGKRIVGFFLLWIPVTLVIESSLVPLEMVFEHRMYLPSVGLFGLAALLIERGIRLGRKARFITGILVLLLIILMISATITSVPVWRTPFSLAKNSVRNAPNSARAWADLGRAYLQEGTVEPAEIALRRSLDLDPNNRWALEYMGIVLMDQGDLDTARNYIARALVKQPSNASLLNSMGEVFLKKRDYLQAERYFFEAASRKPWVAVYRWNRALALENLGRYGDALSEWKEYLDLEESESERAVVRKHILEKYRNERK